MASALGMDMESGTGTLKRQDAAGQRDSHLPKVPGHWSHGSR